MSCPLLADSLNLDSWSVGDFKVTAKSKQRFAPIYASSKFATFRLSPEPLLCPWGVGKFQDVDSGRIEIDVILEVIYLIAALEKIDNWAVAQGKNLNIKGNYKPIVNDNEKYGNKKMKIKVQLDSAKFWSFDKTPCEFFQSLRVHS